MTFCPECHGHDLQERGAILQCNDCGFVVVDNALNPLSVIDQKLRDTTRLTKEGEALLKRAASHLVGGSTRRFFDKITA
jgi:hypothetical protein